MDVVVFVVIVAVVLVFAVVMGKRRADQKAEVLRHQAEKRSR